MANLFPPGQNSPDRILIIKPSAIGDIVNSLPFLKGIRHRFPHAKIAWVINKAYQPLLEQHPDIDQLIPFDRGEWHQTKLGGLKTFFFLIGQIRKFKPCLTIDLQGLFRTGLMAGLSGAKFRVGLEDCREGSRYFYSHRVKYLRPGKMHAVERYWEVARFFGCGEIIPDAPMQPADDSLARVRQQLGAFPKPWMGCAPGARWHTKRWPPNYFSSLFTKAMQTHGGTVVFLGGKEDSEIAGEIQKNLPKEAPCADMTGKTSLGDLVAWVSQLDLLVSNDTGPMHIAVCQHIPVISPFLCTRPEWNGPFGQLKNAIQTTVSCRGSYLKTCPKMICLDELVPDRLWPTLENELNQWKSKTQ
ncbi:MAG: glycosyltransferase family 9 protein [Gemmataceae bacterium]|nr:glycosyltransferase family 9 protein [Gemmataceae bacterium]